EARETTAAADKEAKARLKEAKEAAKAAEAAAEEAVSAADIAAQPPTGPTFPPILDPTTSDYRAPAVDAYSLRLVTRRRLYDDGTLIAAAPSLAKLGDPGRAAANPSDLERIGLHDGDTVALVSAGGSLTTEIHADTMVPAGTIVLPW